MSAAGPESHLPPPRVEEFVFHDWTVRVVKSHIMGSQCEATTPCTKETQDDALCNYCRYERELKLPSLPDMVFANNMLQLSHRDGGSITFTAWRPCAASDCEGAQKVVEPYDWTYTTNFRGTLRGGADAEASSERIDLDKLKVREEIKFYSEIYLYEDELDDNGCTRCVAKVRIMPSGIFVVFRHYLRVDQVIVRINDTRLYSPAGAPYFLRESSTREAPIAQLRESNNNNLAEENIVLLVDFSVNKHMTLGAHRHRGGHPSVVTLQGSPFSVFHRRPDLPYRAHKKRRGLSHALLTTKRRLLTRFFITSVSGQALSGHSEVNANMFRSRHINFVCVVGSGFVGSQ
ncbi:TIP41-like protein [Chionoecetes opilio]|uniref:TIP41-like protein n=1 Tax=Chionoecetes opilio TaxID=41210 RepID=A0A8J8WAD1_CHIOP|nr:TIP41-like protein [Chionoecetes opilio]